MKFDKPPGNLGKTPVQNTERQLNEAEKESSRLRDSLDHMGVAREMIKTVEGAIARLRSASGETIFGVPKDKFIQDSVLKTFRDNERLATELEQQGAREQTKRDRLYSSPASRLEESRDIADDLKKLIEKEGWSLK